MNLPDPKNLIPGLLAAMLLFAPIASSDVAVMPMLIDLDSQSGRTMDFSFSLLGRTDTEVSLSVETVTQTDNGYITFKPPATEQTPASWVSLDKDRYTVKANETTVVNGRVNIPAQAHGTRLAVVIVEEAATERDQSGVRVRVRYGVVLNMNVRGRKGGERIRGDFVGLGSFMESGRHYIGATFTNLSDTDHLLHSEVQIRGLEDNRLLERIELKSKAAWDSGARGSVVFPGAQVRVYGEVSAVASPGPYHLIIRNRLNDRTLPSQRQRFEIASLRTPANGGDTSDLPEDGGLAANISQLAVPETVVMQMRPNGSAFATFYVENPTGSLARIRFPTGSARHPQLASFRFTPASISVAPGSRRKVALAMWTHSDRQIDQVPFTAEVAPDGGQAPYSLSLNTQLTYQD